VIAATTEIPVRVESWTGGLDALRARAADSDTAVHWDIVRVDPDELATGCAEGLFEKLDWPAIGGKDHYLTVGANDCGVGASVANLVLAWDRDKFQATPTWADFWDVAKIPGKRGLGRNVHGALEFALLADGVAAGDIYKTLASPEGVDRAFRKLDQLKPYIVWWQTPDEALKILGSGDVLMTAAPGRLVARADQLEKRNFGLQFAGSLYEPRYWAIMKGSAFQKEATQFLYFTGAPAIQARLFRTGGEAGLAKGVTDFVTPEQQAMMPTFPSNAAAAIRIDNGFWRDNLAKLKPRFDAWLAQ